MLDGLSCLRLRRAPDSLPVFVGQYDAGLAIDTETQPRADVFVLIEQTHRWYAVRPYTEYSAPPLRLAKECKACRFKAQLDATFSSSVREREMRALIQPEGDAGLLIGIGEDQYRGAIGHESQEGADPSVLIV